MAKGGRSRRRIASRQYRAAPYMLRPCGRGISGDLKEFATGLDKKDWEDATCSVCMEYPHNAVLLLCSSHDKGCRPYMCGTSCRFSNCLDQYKKAYTKVISSNQAQGLQGADNPPVAVHDLSWSAEKAEVTELACPLCRGQVKGWTVVEPAREYLNAKTRGCMEDSCSFVGNYRELRKHVKAEHPSARPREVDPVLEQKWMRLERERERNDVISTIRASMPRAVVFGDYVIEGNNYGYDTEEEEEEEGFNVDAMEREVGFEMGFDSNLVNVFLLLHAFGPSGNNLFRRHRQPDGGFLPRSVDPVGSFHLTNQGNENGGSEYDDSAGMSLASRLRRQGTTLLGRSGRRRRPRDGNQSHS